MPSDRNRAASTEATQALGELLADRAADVNIESVSEIRKLRSGD